MVELRLGLKDSFITNLKEKYCFLFLWLSNYQSHCIFIGSSQIHFDFGILILGFIVTSGKVTVGCR